MLVSSQLSNRESIDDLSSLSEHKSLEQTMLDIACRAPVSVQLATSCIAFVLCWMARDSIDLYLLLLWFAITMSVSAIRFWALRVWIPSLTHLSAEKKLQITCFFILPVAIMFGSSGLFYETYRPSEKAVQVFMLYGLMAVSIATLNGARGPYIALAVPIVTGITSGMFYDFIVNDHETSALMAFLSFCYLVTALRFAQLFHQYFFVESYNRQRELSEVNCQLNIALKEIKAASESKDLFFASASHDLRQPIHTVSLLISALSMRQMDDKAKSILVKIESAMQNLSIQMDSMLDIAKLDAGVLETHIQRFDFSALLRSLIDEYEQLAGEKDLVLYSDIPADDILISSDKILLSRLIGNLLSNAIKYTEQGYVSVRAHSDAQTVYIDVVDTGIGISDRDKRRVFDEFYQVAKTERDRRKGLGLGLSIVKRLATLLDIKLDFESTIGVGSQFSLSIPLANDSTPELDISPVQDRAPLFSRGKTLLCVDDEEDVLSAMKLLLSDLGYEVLAASTTKEAIRKASTSKPDALLVDFRLAGKDDGLETIQQVREIAPGIPAILISGDTSPQRLQQANDARVPLLSKPVGIEQIEDALADFFGDE